MCNHETMELWNIETFEHLNSETIKSLSPSTCYFEYTGKKEQTKQSSKSIHLSSQRLWADKNAPSQYTHKCNK